MTSRKFKDFLTPLPLWRAFLPIDLRTCVTKTPTNPPPHCVTSFTNVPQETNTKTNKNDKCKREKFDLKGVSPIHNEGKNKNAY